MSTSRPSPPSTPPPPTSPLAGAGAGPEPEPVPVPVPERGPSSSSGLGPESAPVLLLPSEWCEAVPPLLSTSVPTDVAASSPPSSPSPSPSSPPSTSTEPAPSPPGSPPPISVASFNTLRRNYNFNGWSSTGKSWVAPEDQEWSHRLGLLHSTLRNDLRCDLVGLQEAEIPTFQEDFAEPLSDVYGAVFPVARNEAEARHHGHTRPSVLYRKDRFEETWNTHNSRTMVAEFKCLLTGRFILFGVVHLQGGREVDNSRHRCNQMKSLIQSLNKRLSAVSEPRSVIVCGDFNASAGEAAHQLLSEGSIPQERLEAMEFTGKSLRRLAAFSHSLKLKDSYAAVTPCACPLCLGEKRYDVDALLSREGVHRTWSHKWGTGYDDVHTSYAVLDYIYASEDLTVRAVRDPLGVEERKALESGTHGVGLPDSRHPSDHLPVAVQLGL